MAEQPIVKKVIKKKGHGHHGGAWKLAYADFVTAMMAFFLLMWLLGSTTEETKKGISEYFQDPYEASKMNKGKVPTLEEASPSEMDRQAEQEDRVKLEALKKKIEELIDKDAKLSEFKEQIKLETTPEGLRIQLIDNKNRPMFKTGSSETEPEIQLILRALAPVINNLPNKITINGHTDAQSFSGNRKAYTNWELSSERANTARFVLNQGGLGEEKIMRVAGLSDSVPYNPKDPLDPMNRRISIMVMNKKTEQQILEVSGNKPAAAKDGKPPAAGPPSRQPADGQAGHRPEAVAPPPETHGPPETPGQPAAGAQVKPPPEPERH
jgi:chemotaxis protein MotB